MVEAWRRSGENVTVFARRHGLRRRRLVYWSKRLALRAPPRSPTISFVPAVVAQYELAVVIRAPDGIAIELASATPAQIAVVVTALARPAP